MRVLKLIFGIILFGLTTGSLMADTGISFRTDELFKTDINKTKKAAATLAIQPLGFEMDNSKAKEIFLGAYSQFTLTDFPVSETMKSDVNFETARSIIDANTRWMRGTSYGIVPTEGPALVSYKGKIAGEENSNVYLNYSDGKLYGFIQHEDGEQYTITPVNDDKDNFHLLSNSMNEFADNSLSKYTCGTQPPEGDFEELKKDNYSGDEIQGTKLLQADIAIEAEYKYYQRLGEDYDRAALYISNVMALASRIYEENINVTLYIPYVLIWEEPDNDPYYPNSRLYLNEKLGIMNNVWVQRDVDKTLGVLFADLQSQPADSRVAGISHGGYPKYGSLCDDDKGYCVLGIRGSYDYPTIRYTWDVNVACHEMGHNFSAPHTHSCWYFDTPIDTCVTQEYNGVGDACIKNGPPIPRPGTIMSYCHTTNSSHSVQLFFHEKMKPLMRIASDRANCMKEPKDPIVKLLNPLGDSLYGSGSVVDIRWTSSGVNYVHLRYSTDNGLNWRRIFFNVKAADSIYKWELPNINAEKVLVKIEDVSNSDVSDQSVSHFSIMQPQITIQTPLENKELGQREIHELYWNKTLVETVYIIFSSDGGQTWDTLAQNVDASSYEWKIPEIEAENCIIKVISEQNNTVVAETRNFSIGEPSAVLIYPNGGETLCIGERYDIKWETSYLQKFWLKYSLDNGENWKKVFFLAIDGEKNSFDWAIKHDETEEALIRLESYYDDGVVLDQSESAFKIDSCLTDVAEFNGNADNPLRIKEIIPNPVNSNAQINLSYGLSSAHPIELIVMDQIGNKVISRKVEHPAASGDMALELDLSNVSQGYYFLIIRSGGYQAAAPLQVIR